MARCYRTRVPLPDSVYGQLLALRSGLRHFERWSEQQAHAAGLTPAQHQLLLAIRGHADPRGPTIGEVADYLLLRHHSVVGLIDRADSAGLVTRHRDKADHRIVRLRLTRTGARRLERLSALHLEELERLAPQLSVLTDGLAPVQRAHGFPGAPDTANGEALAASVGVARVYDEPGNQRGRRRVLVDRLWPRGMARAAAPFDDWAKDLAPSSALRKWYGHVPERFDEFARRYREELEEPQALRPLDELRHVATRSGVVLLTATRDVDRSGAVVLRQVLAKG